MHIIWRTVGPCAHVIVLRRDVDGQVRRLARGVSDTFTAYLSYVT